VPIDLAGKPIVITGASSGIGLVTARACAHAGMPVVLAARRLNRLREEAAKIEGQGGRALAIECDVSDAGACKALIDAAEERFGPLYAAFANAGYGHECSIEMSSESQLRDIFEVNFWGTASVFRASLASMRRSGSGHLLACSSCLSKIGMPYFGAYSATKAAQDHLARAMRHELAGSGIHVSSVHPIGTRTEFFEETDKRSERARLAIRTGLAFMQPPERVANAVVACLRRPRGEVWTSMSVRTALGVATIFPQTADRLLGLALRRRLRRRVQAAG